MAPSVNDDGALPAAPSQDPTPRRIAYAVALAILLLGARAVGHAEGVAEAAAVSGVGARVTATPGPFAPSSFSGAALTPTFGAAPLPTLSPTPRAPSPEATLHVAGAWRHAVDPWVLGVQVPGVLSFTQVLSRASHRISPRTIDSQF